MVEPVHWQIKNSLRAHDAGQAWHSHLLWVLLGLHAAPKEDSAVPSAELITGSPLILPVQVLHVLELPPVDMPPPPRPASYAVAADSWLGHILKPQTGGGGGGPGEAQVKSYFLCVCFLLLRQ